jgi:hypothetical protein
MVESVGKLNADLVFVSALPPGAMMHARYLCKRVHAKFSEIPMVIGLWGYQGDLEKAKERVLCDGNVQFVKQLDGAIAAINQLAKPILIRDTEPAPTAK